MDLGYILSKSSPHFPFMFFFVLLFLTYPYSSALYSWQIMIVGPNDSGKTTLSRILTAYAARVDRTPIFVDVDVGQGSCIPGTITALPVKKSGISVEEGFLSANPLVYFYGGTSPRDNMAQYKHLTSVCALKINQRMEKDIDARASGAATLSLGCWERMVLFNHTLPLPSFCAGLIVNSCGWIDGGGYDVLLHTISAFAVDIVLVMNHDRLHHDLIGSLAEVI